MAVESLSLVPAPPPRTASSPEERRPWSPGQRIAFRFGFAYFVLYNFPYPLNDLPKGDKLTAPWHWLLHHVVPWFGRHVLHVTRDLPFGPTGSGDTSYDWVYTAMLLTVAGLATIVWSIVDRRRMRYDLAWALLRIYLRYTLAMTMFSYGFAKVFELQFQSPQSARLAQPYGESSPMGLLWTFMGASRPYTIIAGSAEVVGGALLLFRRTTTLGALVLLGVIGNIVLLNFCYDVPVKLYSSHLWVMALLIVLPHAPRLVDLLVRQRAPAPACPATTGTPFVGRRLRWLRISGKSIFILNLCYEQGYGQLKMVDKHRHDAPQGAMSGAWQVAQIASEPAMPPLDWRRLIIGHDSFGIRSGQGQRKQLKLVDDGTKKTLTLTPLDKPDAKPSVLTYLHDASGRGTLDGTFDGRKLHVELRWVDTKNSLLTTRGFHFINETPFNR